MRIRLVLYAPGGSGALSALGQMHSGLAATEVTSPSALELGDASGKTFDYNSKMQLKGQTLEWTVAACDGHVHSMAARQTLFKGVHGVLLFASQHAELGALTSALVGDFDQVAGRDYAVVVVTDEVGQRSEHPTFPAATPAATLLKELMKASLKVAAASL